MRLENRGLSRDLFWVSRVLSLPPGTLVPSSPSCDSYLNVMITGVNRDHLPAYRHVIFQIHDNWRILEGACSGHASHNRGNHWQCQGVSGGPCLTTLCKNQQQVQCSQGAKDCNSFRHRSSPASVFYCWHSTCT